MTAFVFKPIRVFHFAMARSYVVRDCILIAFDIPRYLINKGGFLQNGEMLYHKTNRTASAVFRSVIKHLGSDESTKEVRRNARLQLAFLPTLLSCSHHFLRALLLNGARFKLFCLLSKWLSSERFLRRRDPLLRGMTSTCISYEALFPMPVFTLSKLGFCNMPKTYPVKLR